MLEAKQQRPLAGIYQEIEAKIVKREMPEGGQRSECRDLRTSLSREGGE